MSLLTKLAAVRSEIGAIEKRGRNNHHHYDYVKAEDVTQRVRELFADQGLVLLPECVNHERHGNMTVAHLNITIADTESGEERAFAWVSEGSDSQDKGIYKAYTGGMKYFLMNLLMIPSTEDPEASNGAGNGQPKPQGEPAKKCPDCSSDMWDNRDDKRNPRSPDFKCKDKSCGKAIWLEDEAPEGVNSETGEIEGDDTPPSEMTADQLQTLAQNVQGRLTIAGQAKVLTQKVAQAAEQAIRDKDGARMLKARDHLNELIQQHGQKEAA